jgi:hypothetical protein
MESDSPPLPPSPFCDLATYARRLGISPRTMRRLQAEGLPVISLSGKLRRVDVTLADAWIATRAWDASRGLVARPGAAKARKAAPASRRKAKAAR